MPLIGDAPLTVTFTDTSTPSDDITYRAWDFGDGNSSTEENPENVYATPGNYTVTLNIASAKGIDQATDTVEVLIPLEMSCTNATPSEGESSIFSVTVGPEGVAPFTYVWTMTWDTGSVNLDNDADSEVSWSESAGGKTFVVSVDVTDSVGNRGHAEMTVTVTEVP